MKTHLILLLCLAAAFAGCHRTEQPAGPSTPPLRVRIVTTESSEVKVGVPVGATVRPLGRATLASRVMASITDLPTELGARVEAGQLLVRLEAHELLARMDRASADLRSATRDHEREAALLGKGASTAESVRALDDRVATASAALREAEAQVAYAEIRAPFSGRIVEKLVKAGDLASPGRALLVLEAEDGLEAIAAVPASLANGLKPGLEIRTRDLNTVLSVQEVSPAADAATRTVEARLRPLGVFPYQSGDYITLNIPTGAGEAAILVPSGALVERGQMEYVWAVGPGERVHLRVVRSGRTFPGGVEIVAGLTAGERVVTSPSRSLVDGAPVEVVP